MKNNKPHIEVCPKCGSKLMLKRFGSSFYCDCKRCGNSFCCVCKQCSKSKCGLQHSFTFSSVSAGSKARGNRKKYQVIPWVTAQNPLEKPHIHFATVRMSTVALLKKANKSKYYRKQLSNLTSYEKEKSISLK